MKNNIVEYNTLKKLKLIEKILKCNGNYRLICIDVDDVVYNVDNVVQEILSKIDERATKKYYEKLSHETTEDMLQELKKSFDILNAILEETRYIEYDDEKDRTIIHDYKQIDYNEIYQDKNLIPGAVDFIKLMIKSKQPNDFFIFLSHKNPEREGIVKMANLYRLFPEIDAIETLPFHVEVRSKIVNSKALWIKQVYGIDDLSKCLLIDNSKSNCKDFRKHDGLDIRYLPEGFDGTHTLADHMSKLTNLDPHMLQFAISYINYARNNPNYIDEVDMSLKIQKK